MNEALITRDLVKRYGKGNGLNGFSIAIPKGSMMGLVGRNGAGKTTWMMSVVGFVRPHSGSIDILGRGPFDAAVHSGRISILPQDSELPLEAHPFELLYRYGRLQGMKVNDARTSARKLLEAMNLADRGNRPIRTLSHGMRKRVMIAQAFMGEPEIVLLDEPMSGLDPVEIDRMRTFLLARRGRQTVVISSHILDDIEKLCTHVAFVDAGKVTRMSKLEDLTLDTGRVAYSLRDAPDLEALRAAVGYASFAWNDRSHELVTTFDVEAKSVVDHNTIVLPLLTRYGVVAVVPGKSLEQAYLEK